MCTAWTRSPCSAQCSSGGSTAPIVLDLIGHSTRDHHLLRLGDDPIDTLDPAVARFFRAPASDRLPARCKPSAAT
jgi:hypothetical protein